MFDELNQIQSRKRKMKSGGDLWILSYADVVTVLLCFFIIFYSIEKQLERVDKDSFLNLNNLAQNSQDTNQRGNSILPPNFINDISQEYDVKTLKSRIEITITNEHIFRKGKIEVTRNGQNKIKDLLSLLAPYKDQIILGVQGFTDSTPVLKRKGRWWSNNLELSVLRALSVQKHLIREGFPEDQIFVVGYGIGTSKKDKEKNKRIKLRAVTFRVEKR